MRIILLLVAVWLSLVNGINPETQHWLSMCRNDVFQCNLWKKMVLQSDQAFIDFMSYNETLQFADKSFFDPIEPVWNCLTRRRVPQTGGDGPKWMCGVESLPAQALVYSFGSNGDISFESSLRKLVPRAEFFVFDPTLTEASARIVRSHNFSLLESGLVGLNLTSLSYASKVFPAKDLRAHMLSLGHKSRVVDVLKIDIEGSEYAALSNVRIGSCRGADVKVDQLLIEMHVIDPNESKQIRDLVRNLHSCGMKLFNKEKNHWYRSLDYYYYSLLSACFFRGCAGARCAEFSFISAEFAYRTFRATHFPS